jgi:hypothetical protein
MPGTLLFGVGTDIGGAIYVSQKANSGIEAMKVPIGEAMAGIVATKALTSGSGAAANSGATAGKDAKRDNSACYAMGVNILQSTLRVVHMYEDSNKAKQLREQKKTMLGNNPVPKMAGDGSSNGILGGDAQTPGLTNPNSPHTSDSKVAQGSGEATTSNAAMAALGPLMNQYEKVTGQPASDLANVVKNGGNLPQFLAKTFGDKIGADGVGMLAAIDKQSSQMIADHRDELEAQNKKITVASASSFEMQSKGGGSSAPKGNDMPDFGALMSGLLGKKPGEEKGPEGVRALAFSNAAAKPGNEGLHPASRSIFDVVGSRYQLISNRFLSGDMLVKPQQSTLPNNPYLTR